jgi:hypothetical protein
MEDSFRDDPVKFVILYSQNRLWKKAGHDERGVPRFSAFEQLLYYQMKALQSPGMVNYQRLVWYNFERDWTAGSAQAHLLPEMRAHWFETMARINRGSWFQRKGGDWAILIGGGILIVALWMAFT